MSNTNDLIRRGDAIEAIRMIPADLGRRELDDAIEAIEGLPTAQPLTDTEQRIFLAAISREEEVCKKVDAEWGEGDEECEINLVHVCHEIVRKVKGALWT